MQSAFPKEGYWRDFELYMFSLKNLNRKTQTKNSGKRRKSHEREKYTVLTNIYAYVCTYIEHLKISFQLFDSSSLIIAIVYSS